MRVRAVESTRIHEIQSENWVDTRRRPFVEGAIAWVPVRDGEPCDCEIPERHPYRGRGFFMVGDIAVIHGEKPGHGELMKIIGFRHPRGIVWIESLNDVTRVPRTEVLWGEAGEVEHRESGYMYILDPCQVMFSQGNRNEKMRLARLVANSGKTERIADMFAGIGYFTIPMAGAGADVHAMEINPVAFGYLNRNIAANGLDGRVTTSPGDCRDLLVGVYDRVVMGHFEAIGMLPHALRHTCAGSIIHLHSIGSCEEEIQTIAAGAGFSATIHVHKVKKYRLHAWHVVQDVILS